jgi:hypothetical protein
MPTPLNDLAGDYAGFPGKLYNGTNLRPPAYTALAPTIIPIDGKVGLVSLGMSNCRMDWFKFEDMQRTTGTPMNVTLINGAKGGELAHEWADPNHATWDWFADAIQQSGVVPQVCWMKCAELPEGMPGIWPEDAIQIKEWFAQTLVNLKSKYPTIKSVYISTRTYGGYVGEGSKTHEPLAYENGFSAKWLVQDYIDGRGVPDLWLSWGPYLWADGLTPRNDGLIWERNDFIRDGLHPTVKGAIKVALRLRIGFANDPSSSGWWN